MNVIVVGCGRVGVQLALSLVGEHRVSVIDTRARAFDRLGAQFGGRTVQGEATHMEVLVRAGVEETDALAAVTTSDNVNAVVSQVARERFHVPRVVARVYNPGRAPLYEKLGLATVASSTWGANRIRQMLLHPGMAGVCSAGNGEVTVFEVTVNGRWNGKPLEDLIPDGEALAVALVRDGQATIPRPPVRLRAEDSLLISATARGAELLHARLNGKDA